MLKKSFKKVFVEKMSAQDKCGGNGGGGHHNHHNHHNHNENNFSTCNQCNLNPCDCNVIRCNICRLNPCACNGTFNTCARCGMDPCRCRICPSCQRLPCICYDVCNQCNSNPCGCQKRPYYPLCNSCNQSNCRGECVIPQNNNCAPCAAMVIPQNNCSPCAAIVEIPKPFCGGYGNSCNIVNCSQCNYCPKCRNHPCKCCRKCNHNPCDCMQLYNSYYTQQSYPSVCFTCHSTPCVCRCKQCRKIPCRCRECNVCQSRPCKCNASNRCRKSSCQYGCQCNMSCDTCISCESINLTRNSMATFFRSKVLDIPQFYPLPCNNSLCGAAVTVNLQPGEKVICNPRTKTCLPPSVKLQVITPGSACGLPVFFEYCKISNCRVTSFLLRAPQGHNISEWELQFSSGNCTSAEWNTIYGPVSSNELMNPPDLPFVDILEGMLMQLNRPVCNANTWRLKIKSLADASKGYVQLTEFSLYQDVLYNGAADPSFPRLPPRFNCSLQNGCNNSCGGGRCGYRR